jgi:hypothetical protein
MDMNWLCPGSDAGRVGLISSAVSKEHTKKDEPNKIRQVVPPHKQSAATAASSFTPFLAAPQDRRTAGPPFRSTAAPLHAA